MAFKNNGAHIPQRLCRASAKVDDDTGRLRSGTGDLVEDMQVIARQVKAEI